MMGCSDEGSRLGRTESEGAEAAEVFEYVIGAGGAKLRDGVDGTCGDGNGA